MISLNSVVFVSTDKFIKDLSVDEIDQYLIEQDKAYKPKKIYAVSYHSGIGQFDYSQIAKMDLEIPKKIVPGTWLKLVFETPAGRYRQLVCTPDQKIYVCGAFDDFRNYVSAANIDMMEDVIIDEENQFCKLVYREAIDSEPGCNISVLYNNSYFANGILVKGD